MAEIPAWFVGNRNPSIAETITADGTVVDLTGKTVRFKGRVAGGGSSSTALIVDADATVVSAALGSVRYDWSPTDILTGGPLADPHFMLIWWEVTTTSGGRVQDTPEALIEVRSHTSSAYVELEEFKSSAELTGYSYADEDIQRAIIAASRGIDSATGRRFYLDADATSVRYYTPTSSRRLMIDDVVTLTSVQIDRGGDGTFEETWTRGTEFVVEPANAVADGRPWESLLRRAQRGYSFPCGLEDSVKVTGQFGWQSVPAPIEQAAIIVASKLVKRTREAPFGIVAVGVGGDAGAALRIARSDPDVLSLIADYVRHQPFA